SVAAFLFKEQGRPPLPSYPTADRCPAFGVVLNTLVQAEGLPFRDVLSEGPIQAACTAEGVSFGNGRADVYTPALTLGAFLAQVLAKDQPCVGAVARFLVLWAAWGRPLGDAEPSADRKARAKLTEPLLRRLTLEVGPQLERSAPADWRWKNRHVFLADGTTAT